MKFKKVRWVLLFGLLFIVVPVKPDSKEFVDIYQVFLKNELPSNQQIKESFINLSTIPFQRKELAFSLLVPKDWRDNPLKVSPEVLEYDTENMVPVTLQLAPKDEKGNARIEVAYIRMERELDISDLVDFYLEANDLKVLMRREGTYNQRKIEEALIYSENVSKSYMVRMTFSRHGNLVFLVSGSAIESEFLRYSQIFAAAAVSFTLQQKQSTLYVEPMDTYVSTGQSSLEFKYPQNWHLKEAQDLPAGKWGVNISLPAQGERGNTGKTAALVHIKWIDQSIGEKPEKMLNDLTKDFESISVDFNHLTLEADLDSNLDAPLGKLKKWEAVLSESQIEVSLLVWPKGSSYLALGILTPSPQVSRYTWMHAWKVFDIIASELIEKQLPLIRIKNLNLPQEDWLADRALRTMSIFSWGVMNEDFSRFYADLAPVFQASTAPQKLLQTFKRFKQREELNELEKHVPVLDHPIWINEAGELPLSGCFSTRPRNTCFEFIYKHAQEEWKLVSIHVFLEDRDEK
jgi:hypothetical protein